METVRNLIDRLHEMAESTYITVGRKSLPLLDAPKATVARWYADRLREFAAKE